MGFFCLAFWRKLSSLPLDLKRHKLGFGRAVVYSDQSIGMWDSFNFGE